MNIAPFAALAGSAIVQASGSAVMKLATAANAGPAPNRGRFLLLAFAAMALFGCGFPLYMVGLSKLKLSVAQPIFSASMFLATTGIALVFFREAMGLRQAIGLALIVGGIALVAIR
jgi:Membrane transporters of cations and cationic drugs